MNISKCMDVRQEKRQELNNEKIFLIEEQTPREMEIEHLIRERYSLSQEIAILRKIHLGKISDEEFKEYSDYVEDCVDKVPEEMNEQSE